MTDIIERVARAIDPEVWRSFDTIKGDFPDLAAGSIPAGPAESLRRARAAIEAMREPTEAMWRAAGNENGYVTEAAWRAMIDAALRY